MNHISLGLPVQMPAWTIFPLASQSKCLHEPYFPWPPSPNACMNPISLGLPVLMPGWTLFPLASQSKCLHEPYFPLPPSPNACMNPISVGLPVLMPACLTFPLAWHMLNPNPNAHMLAFPCLPCRFPLPHSRHIQFHFTVVCISLSITNLSGPFPQLIATTSISESHGKKFEFQNRLDTHFWRLLCFRALEFWIQINNIQHVPKPGPLPNYTMHNIVLHSLLSPSLFLR
jgi:hypothetical protein